MTFSFFVISILNSFAMIFASAKLLESKINYDNNKIMSYKDIVTLKGKDLEIANLVHELEKNYQKL